MEYMAGTASWRIRVLYAYIVQPYKQSNESGTENAVSVTKIVNNLMRYADNGYML